MAQDQARFSPAQVLMAAEKAEADGRLEYAVQFYRHIVEKTGEAPEAAHAYSALGRLAMLRPDLTDEAATGSTSHSKGKSGAAAAGINDSTHSNGYSHHPVHAAAGQPMWPPTQGQASPDMLSRRPAGSTSQPTIRGQVPAFPGSAAPSQSAAAQASTASFPASRDADPYQGSYGGTGPVRSEQPTYPPARMPVFINLPRRKRGYRTGRAIASIAMVLGIMMIGIGIALISATFIAGGQLAQIAPQIPALVAIASGIGTAVLGVLMIFVSQLSRAIFDGANAVRELVAIERAIARQSARGKSNTLDD